MQNYLPSEYGMSELYTWCNEVSAMLAAEDRIVIREARVPLARDKTVLLPEGVGTENVIGVYDGARRLRLLPHRPMRAECGAGCDEVTVLYEEPFCPIRLVRYSGAVTVDPGENRLYIHDCRFKRGDTLTFSADGYTAGGIQLMEVDYDPDDERGYILTVSDGALDEVPEPEYEVCEIKREVTDKTVCDAPFDVMYVDYLLAKTAQYQRDPTAYAAYTAAFDSTLAAYRGWLTSRMPHRKNKFRGYW